MVKDPCQSLGLRRFNYTILVLQILHCQTANISGNNAVTKYGNGRAGFGVRENGENGIGNGEWRMKYVGGSKIGVESRYIGD